MKRKDLLFTVAVFFLFFSTYILSVEDVKAQEKREYKLYEGTTRFSGIRSNAEIYKENYVDALKYTAVNDLGSGGNVTEFVPQNNRIYKLDFSAKPLPDSDYIARGISFKSNIYGSDLGIYDEVEKTVLRYDLFIGGNNLNHYVYRKENFLLFGADRYDAPPYTLMISLQSSNGITRSYPVAPELFSSMWGSSFLWGYYKSEGLNWYRYKGEIDITDMKGDLTITTYVISGKTYITGTGILSGLQIPTNIQWFSPNFLMAVKDISLLTNISAPEGFMGIRKGGVSAALNKYSTENQFILSAPVSGNQLGEAGAWYNLDVLPGYESVELSSNGPYDDIISYSTYPVMFHSMFEYWKDPMTGENRHWGTLSAKVKTPYMLESDVKKKFALSIEFFTKASEVQNTPLPNEVGGGEGPFMIVFGNNTDNNDPYFYSKNVLVEKYMDKNKDTWLRFRAYYDLTEEFGTVINTNENGYIHFFMSWGTTDGSRVFFSDLSVEYEYDNYLTPEDRKTVVEIVSKNTYNSTEDKIAAEKEAMYQTDSGKEVIDAANKQIEENRNKEILKYVILIVGISGIVAGIMIGYYVLKKRKVSGKPRL